METAGEGSGQLHQLVSAVVADGGIFCSKLCNMIVPLSQGSLQEVSNLGKLIVDGLLTSQKTAAAKINLNLRG